MNLAAWPTKGAAFAALMCACAALWFPLSSSANGSTAAAASPSKITWASLSAAQRLALQPLQKDWHTLTADRQKTWVEVAARMPIMSGEERSRVRERMAEWARMTPSQRARARLQFQDFRQWPSEDRQAIWEAYLALSETERAQLAGQAQRNKSGKSMATPMREAGTARSKPKTNLISTPSQVTLGRKSVAPTVVQIKPGATTQLISRTVSPPPHHQPGLPKIAATANFVDPQTLLPKRGPQAAAMAVSSAAAPAHP
jgi:hypothetical protein